MCKTLLTVILEDSRAKSEFEGMKGKNYFLNCPSVSDGKDIVGFRIHQN